MQPNNSWFVDVFPFPRDLFQLPCYFSRGVINAFLRKLFVEANGFHGCGSILTRVLPLEEREALIGDSSFLASNNLMEG